jgi:imidazolonepropionase-like amidohydrolase
MRQRTPQVEPDYLKILREDAGLRRLMRAFAKIADKEVRHGAVKLIEKIAGIKPTPRKRRPK